MPLKKCHMSEQDPIHIDYNLDPDLDPSWKNQIQNEEYQVLEFEKIWRRSWDDAEPEEEEKEEEGGMTRKEGGLVLSVRGGRMEVLINQEKRSLNLAQIWKENYLPVKGDQLLFSCRVKGDDSDFNGSKIVLAVPQRMKEYI